MCDNKQLAAAEFVNLKLGSRWFPVRLDALTVEAIVEKKKKKSNYLV